MDQTPTTQALADCHHDPGRAGPDGVGRVWLVGAGPGDAELLTIKALRLLQRADAVVYDHLVSDEILALAGREALRIYVGKESGNHTLPQESINALLAGLALAGKRVVRLKGGDPFIFGRGGEEVEQLALQGIPFEIVPGVTSASGVSCYAGIPLTHRDHAQSVIFVTGHLRDGGADLDWPALVRPRQTIVVYMGLAALGEICRQLTAHGLPAAMPAAAVERGTTPAQRVVTGDLDTLPRLVIEAGLRSPVLVIVGEVVGLRSRLSWFANEQGAGEPPAAPLPSARRAARIHEQSRPATLERVPGS
jgi:uroporphyrin-III C-methyltransferase